MQYLLDTNVVSDFLKGVANVQRRLRATSPDDVAVSTVTVMEIEYGLALDMARARRIGPATRALLASCEVLPLSSEDARSAGRIRATLRRRGKPIGSYDVLIGGCALARGLTMVTANAAEFARIDGLVVESWR